MTTQVKLTDYARAFVEERYLWTDPATGVRETVEGMLRRVAVAVAAAETEFSSFHAFAADWSDKFYEMMARLDFLPSSPTLLNAGTGSKQAWASCYVIPVEDTIESIMDAAKAQAIIQASSGGTGFSFSSLRPKGSLVKSSGGQAGGPVSFLRLFNQVAHEIMQGGKRQGANMGILSSEHPDLEEFIRCKLNGGIDHFNISVGITDQFMAALAGKSGNGLPFGAYIRDPQTGEVIGTRDARKVWDEIMYCAWKTGDPGLVFLDRINHSAANPFSSVERIEATNPCAEQPLGPWDACTLGSINLANFVDLSADTSYRVDWQRLEEVTRLAVRFLDDVLDVSPWPLPQIAATTHGNRRIGLGVMGWADLLYKLGIPYDSVQAVGFAETVMEDIQRWSWDESRALARDRGPFARWEESDGYKRHDEPSRNSAITTIAPTGSIAVIAGVSSGIEPVFALAFHHVATRPDGTVRDMYIVNEPFQDALSRTMSGQDTASMIRDVSTRTDCPGSVKGLWLNQTMEHVFTTALEIAPEWHVRMQAAFQQYVDNAVSKTVNLPESATPDDIAATYLAAWDSGCRGITVFRTGSKGGQSVLRAGDNVTTNVTPEQEQISRVVTTEMTKLWKTNPRVLSDYAEAHRYRVTTAMGTAHVHISTDADGPLEVYARVGKVGTEVAALTDALGRLASLILQLPSNVAPLERLRAITEQLQGIGGQQAGFGPSRTLSLPDGIAQALARHYNTAQLQDYVVGVDQGSPEGDYSASADYAVPTIHERIEEKLNALGAQMTHEFLYGKSETAVGDLCPECHKPTLIRAEGCERCTSCYYSRC